MKQVFEMTDADLEKMKSISQDNTPVMKFGDYWIGFDKQERANTFWKELSEREGFDWDSVEDAGTGNVKQFKAIPYDPISTNPLEHEQSK